VCVCVFVRARARALACNPAYPACKVHVFYFTVIRTLSGSTISHKWCDFRRKKLLNIKSAFSFSLQILSKTFPTLTRIQRDMATNMKTFYAKNLLFLSDFNKTWLFSTYFWKKKFKNQFFFKIRPEWVELFHVNQRTDITNLTDPFRNFSNAPKRVTIVKDHLNYGLSWNRHHCWDDYNCAGQLSVSKLD
jgi:hypothetical protein